MFKRKLLTALALIAAPLIGQAIEEPAYEVQRRIDKIELRQYAPYVVAEVLVTGPADKAGNLAFPILAGYIFGKNKGERKFAMTAPVTTTPVKLEMTAPVTQTATPAGYLVQFVLPKGVTLDSAPEPIDSRVKLREVPGNRVAAIIYSGFWSEANEAEHLGQLKAALQSAGLAWTGEPVLSRYDPPWTPWFMRRNEIWLSIP